MAREFSFRKIYKTGFLTAFFWFLPLLPITGYADDLDNWNLRSQPLPDSVLRSVAYGNDTFVVVGAEDVEMGAKGVILTSPYGETWTQRTSGADYSLLEVCYGNNTFVAVGGDIIYTSSDGVTWTSNTIETAISFRSVKYCNDIFIAVGMGVGRAIGGVAFTSSDGITWTGGEAASPACTLEGIDYGNNTFVAVGNFVIDGDYIIRTSPDGINWTQISWPSDKRLTLGDVVFGKNTFIAVGYYYRYTDSMGCIITSIDGIDWTPRASNTSGFLQRIAYGSKTFVTVGGENTILTSTDGVTWTERMPGTNTDFYGIGYGDDTFIAVGTNGVILQSDPVTDDDSSDPSGGGGGGGGCFITTVIY